VCLPPPPGSDANKSARAANAVNRRGPSHGQSKAGASPRTPPEGAALRTPAKGTTLGTLQLVGGPGGQRPIGGVQGGALTLLHFTRRPSSTLRKGAVARQAGGFSAGASHARQPDP